MRGYNLSSKPDGVHAYDTDKLTDDIRYLVHERGAESALLVGHDWGGTVAWDTAMSHPEVVERLAILNVAHPRQFLQGLHHPGQLRKSWYGSSPSSACRTCPSSCWRAGTAVLDLLRQTPDVGPQRAGRGGHRRNGALRSG